MSRQIPIVPFAGFHFEWYDSQLAEDMVAYGSGQPGSVGLNMSPGCSFVRIECGCCRAESGYEQGRKRLQTDQQRITNGLLRVDGCTCSARVAVFSRRWSCDRRPDTGNERDRHRQSEGILTARFDRATCRSARAIRAAFARSYNIYLSRDLLSPYCTTAFAIIPVVMIVIIFFFQGHTRQLYSACALILHRK